MLTTKTFEDLGVMLGGQSRIQYSLERFQAALEELGNPEKSVKTILIGGTNGKGSTTLFLSSILVQAGMRVATYLSPHLQSPTERLLKDLKPISNEELDSYAQELFPLARKHELTYFEFLTLIFYVWAAKEKPDFAVVEVGLGGRLDATNVGNPIASVLTNIGIDHCAFLGNTHKEILLEKLPIARRGSPLFCGIEEPELREEVKSWSQKQEVPVRWMPENYPRAESRGWEGQTFQWQGEAYFAKNPSFATVKNAVLAIEVAKTLIPNIQREALTQGIAASRNPGRMETVSLSPRVVLSGDHNLEGIESLKEVVSALPFGRLFILAGFSPDKPYRKMLEQLKTLSKLIFTTQISAKKEQMPEDYSELPFFEQDPKKAVKEILSQMQATDTLLITGSLYLVGEVRGLWKSEVQFADTAPKAH